MITTRRHLLAAASACAAIAFAPASRAAESAATGAATALKAPLLGPASAPKRLVAWGSCTCPFTAQLFTLLKPIVKDLNDRVSVEWRHFPTHPPDPALHVAALGFEGERFWGFMFRVLDAVYAAGGQYKHLDEAKLTAFAEAEGGSAETLKAAYADKAKWQSVKDDLTAGQLLGVTRTPGLFHNGYFLTAQGLPFDLKAFDASLRAMLKA